VELHPFRPFPLLRTPRLVLRQLGPGDAAALFTVCSDPETMKFWSTPPHESVAETEAMLRGSAEGVGVGEFIEWGITLEGADELVVGKIGHHRWLRMHQRSEVGYILRRDLWGRGLTSEALRAVLEFGWARMHLHSVEAQLDPRNRRSARVLEAVGFVKEGHLRENLIVDGRYCDTAIYSLLRPRERD
jgi:ribosomal-protein-alanine N-acetyltransferase